MSVGNFSARKCLRHLRTRPIFGPSWVTYRTTSTPGAAAPHQPPRDSDIRAVPRKKNASPEAGVTPEVSPNDM